MEKQKITILLEKDLAKQLKIKAIETDRTLSRYIAHIIKLHIKKE